MKKGLSKMLTVLLSAGIIMSALAGCGSNAAKTNSADNKLSGSILALGSSALQPLAAEAAKQFKEKNPDADVQVQGGGSGNGLKAVSDGSAQIGNSDIFAEEKSGIDAKALEDHKVCVVGFATVVNPNVKIDNLTKAQLVDIFTGKVTNWKQVGGDDKAIVIINRPSSSGTRATFKKYALDGKEEAAGKALTEDNSGTVLKAVADTDGAISYLALSYIKDNSIKALKLDGIEPTAANITSGKYPIWSYEHMYTKGAAQGLAKAFIDYMTSDEVKPLITKLGYIPINDMTVSR
jgi:phosphate transport system substrate-binding protein